MTSRLPHSALIFAVFICVFLNGASEPANSQQKERTAEQVYRNIQVFQGLPAPQLLGAMNFMAGSLGVSCNHCHVPNQFAKDDKPAKQTARQHLQMMRSINEANFKGETVVNCATCHRAEMRPASALVLSENPFSSSVKVADVSEPLPTVDQILDKYIQAIGGRKKTEKLETLTITGTREMRNGTDPASTEELAIYRKAPNKLLMDFKASAGSSLQAFNGTGGWRKFNGRVSPLGGADLVGAKRDADLYKDIKFKDQYVNLVVVGKETIAGRKAFVIEGTFPETFPARAMFGIKSERLYFDIQNGLLVRRSMEFRTPLGQLPEITDYLDYRKSGGMMFPFTVRLSRPPLVVTQKFAEIKVNAPVEDAIFEMPVAK